MTSRARILGLTVLATLACGSAGAWAQDASGLPGGATSLNEAHGDWTVGCALQIQGETTAKVCNLLQEQVDGKTRQRVVAIELRPAKAGAKATIVLPFGLDLQAGLSMQIDDGSTTATHTFRTCLPAGCLVEADLNDETLAALGKGSVLKLKTVADGGKETPFSISLKGFKAAYARTVDLAK